MRAISALPSRPHRESDTSAEPAEGAAFVTIADPGHEPGSFVSGIVVGRSTTVQSRSDLLESRVIHGPVVILIGGRINPGRPGPRRDRRSPATDHTPLVA
jgi:hypothetical protein